MRTALLMCFLFAFTACSGVFKSGTSQQKSNCAGIFGGPCERRPVNDWWLHPEKV